MNIKQWLGQTTTGAGFATVLASAGAVVTGAMGWQQALPMVLAGVAGLVWPENSPLQAAAKQTATDLESLIAATQTGAKQGAQTPASQASVSAVK